MKNKIFIPIVLTVSAIFSSCLKDTPFMDVSNKRPIIEFGLSAASGNFGPFAYGGNTLAQYDTAIALVIASPQVLGTSVTATVQLDTAQVGAFNAMNNDTLIVMPDSLYSLSSTTISIAAGFRVGSIPVVFNFQKFPAHYAYALPLKIVGAYMGSTSDDLIVSPNSNTFMWYFQQ